MMPFRGQEEPSDASNFIAGSQMADAHDWMDTPDALRQRAAEFAGDARSAQDEVAFRELETLAVLYESYAAELDVASPAETAESLRARASEVHLRADNTSDEACRDALRAIVAVYLSAASERESKTGIVAVGQADRT
jgi:hypothetical protein